MKREDAPRTRFWIVLVAEESLDASGFVKERQRAGESGGEKFRQAGGVTPGLLGDNGKRRARLFRFDDAQGFAIHEQEIIAWAGVERNFAQRNAASGGKIHRFEILHDPTGREEHRINLLAGFFLWSHEPV